MYKSSILSGSTMLMWSTSYVSSLFSTVIVNVSLSLSLSKSENSLALGSPRWADNTACVLSPPTGSDEPERLPTATFNMSSEVP